MNAITYLRTVPVVHDETTARASCAVHADMALGRAIEHLAQWTEAYFADAVRDPTQRAKVSAAMVAVSHARDMIAPLMTGRVS